MQVIISGFETTATSLPAGTALGGYFFRLTKDGLPHDSKNVPAPLPESVTMTVHSYGTYTLEITRLNAQGIAIGAPYTRSVPVLAPQPVLADMVTGATVTVA